MQARVEFSAAPPVLRNVFACLVHEKPECVVDLVRNLRYLDPTSAVLLYNGSHNPHLLDGTFPFARYGAVLHPTPRPMAWGRLHDFALDCMRFALSHLPFDTLTIVDSDQLALRSGYSARLADFFAEQRGVGLLGNCPDVQTAATRIPPARIAHAEIDLWRPFLRRFPEGEAKFVHWSFWPTTVFTAPAARDLVRLCDEDTQLQQILRITRAWATEEVILPTLVALLGYRVAANPCSYDFVKFRAAYSIQQLETALDRSDVFWAHSDSPRIRRSAAQAHAQPLRGLHPAATARVCRRIGDPISAVADIAHPDAHETHRRLAGRRRGGPAHWRDRPRPERTTRSQRGCRGRQLLRPRHCGPGQRGPDRSANGPRQGGGPARRQDRRGRTVCLRRSHAAEVEDQHCRGRPE